jgi:hypothetical protein
MPKRAKAPRKAGKPKRASPSGAPRLDDDPRWLPLIEVHKRLSQRAGSGYHAAADLTAALARKLLRCMRRNIASRVREWVAAALWTDHELYEDAPRWVVGPRNRPKCTTLRPSKSVPVCPHELT